MMAAFKHGEWEGIPVKLGRLQVGYMWRFYAIPSEGCSEMKGCAYRNTLNICLGML